MPLEISYQIFRASWMDFVPPVSWAVGFLLVIVLGRAETRRVRKLLLWVLPVFLLWTGFVVFLFRTPRSRGAWITSRDSLESILGHKREQLQ
jgi:hypothetical protein